MSVSVAICCQVNIYAEGMTKLLEEDDEISVTGVCTEKLAIERLLRENPDIIVTDVTNCKNVFHAYSNSEKKRILLINDKKMQFDGDDLRMMILDGLGGLLPVNTDSSSFRKAVKKLYDGELWIDRHSMGEVFISTGRARREANLTKKEKEILLCICEGLSNKEIANKLYISEQTVKSHCNHLFKKFGVKSRLKLAISAPKFLSETHDLQ